MLSRLFGSNNSSRISSAFGPLILTMPIPASPGAVEIAAIVSSNIFSPLYQAIKTQRQLGFIVMSFILIAVLLLEIYSHLSVWILSFAPGGNIFVALKSRVNNSSFIWVHRFKYNVLFIFSGFVCQLFS